MEKVKEVKMNVFEKLSEARVRLQDIKLNKSGKNPYAGFKYFELADFLPLVNKIFLELKLCSSLKIQEDIAVLKIFNAETNQEDCIEFSCPFNVPEAKVNKEGKAILDKMQCVGAAITYVRRYLHMMALEIVESDLLDAICYEQEKEINSIDNIEGLNYAFEKFGREGMEPQLKRIIWNKAKKIGSCFKDGQFVPA